MSEHPAELLAQLATIDTPTVCNALGESSHRSAVASATRWSPWSAPVPSLA